MKYEKSFGNNDKDGKKNEHNLKNYNRASSKRYSNNEENGEYNKLLYHNNKPHGNNRYNNKFDSQKPNSLYFSQNGKKNNNNEINNKTIDRRKNKNNDYNRPFYKKGIINDKNNKGKSYSHPHKKYIRSEKHFKQKLYNNNNYNSNNFDNNNNYDENYYGNYTNNSSNINPNKTKQENINIELSNLHRDLHNLLFNASNINENDKNNDTSDDHIINNINNNSALNNVDTEYNKFYNFSIIKNKNDVDKNIEASLNLESQNKSSNDSVLNTLSILRTIPFKTSGSIKDSNSSISDNNSDIENRNSNFPKNNHDNNMEGYRDDKYIKNNLEKNNHFNHGNTIVNNRINDGHVGNYISGYNQQIEHKNMDRNISKGIHNKYDSNGHEFFQESQFSNNEHSDSSSNIGDKLAEHNNFNNRNIYEKNNDKTNFDENTNFNDNIFPETQIKESLKVLNTLQVDIERVCCYIKHFSDPPDKLFEVMNEVFLDNTILLNSKIAIFYVYNHLIQELRNNYRNNFDKYIYIANKGLEIFVIPILRYILTEQVKNIEMINKFYRCISIWNERNIYSKFICDQLIALQKNPQKKIEINIKNITNKAHTLLSNELSNFVPLNFILKMPSINNEHKKALNNEIIKSLFINPSKETLKDLDNKNIEEASKMSDKVMRMFGQELILVNSQILELASLISDNNDCLVKLRASMDNLKD
ncbi:conserved Plasmodium protein, unknown function [Plasmodium berghei]|uniref:CID domain-containing protein n=3 Tax=Plasmodium berghei TaxID=5821 RepID=A0A509AHV6_PLABA|nr:conserved Plasmodium protein, unknown function [Plasmodium berghei ANKA]CXI40658.1 conserved Plasmodium protein, unknown function [Plasmodium berghei]SCM21832.1 conserved Plasmodium protein, unknown function [Plasmodium berghei]SCN25078.1 conserved Plasmodium protein, unknown function [Plasmodium berghei]SCO60100.1 conserved Plasmodium protein, unknown function [Plasmodium berghei]SCO61639.1 conserved Plasmodium protein, unknown function [Plasmodium berghei]|eukprot:XP_034421433.1 conserved Plasmodium protein, unknown function [Plasmodium berghei ANKA]